MSAFRRKRPFLGKAVPVLSTLFVWGILFVISTWSLTVWVYLVSLVISYVFADMVLDFFLYDEGDGTLRTKFPRKRALNTKTEAFARYFSAILIGTAIGDTVAQFALQGLEGWFKILFPFLSLQDDIYVIGGGGSLALVSIAWGAF
ncbi:MAG: hypothetical protein ACLQEQ_00660 [Nitrososphaerales archaeon]